MAQAFNNRSTSGELGEDVDKGIAVTRSAGKWVAATATNAQGVTQDAGDEGDLVTIVLEGAVDVRQAGVLTPGGIVACNADGRFVDSPGGTSLDLGEAIEAGVAPQGDQFAFAQILLFGKKIATP